MRIAITGATGFLGRAVVAALSEAGHAVAAIARRDGLRGRPGDLRVAWHDPDAAGLAAAVAGADAAVHLATCYGRPGEGAGALVAANIDLPARLSEAAAQAGVPLLLGDTFFANPGTAYDHLAAYTASKRACATLVPALVAGRVPVALLVFEHLYGPGDDPRKALPALTARIAGGSGRLALTDGLQRRDFIHVRDAAAAVVTACAHVRSIPCGQPFRISVGTGRSASMRDVLETLHRLTGSTVELGWGDLPRRAGEPESTGADIAWLAAHGWQPRIALEEGLRDLLPGRIDG
jgi:CDP-paratose synthetase